MPPSLCSPAKHTYRVPYESQAPHWKGVECLHGFSTHSPGFPGGNGCVISMAVWSPPGLLWGPTLALWIEGVIDSPLSLPQLKTHKHLVKDISQPLFTVRPAPSARSSDSGAALTVPGFVDQVTIGICCGGGCVRCGVSSSILALPTECRL